MAVSGTEPVSSEGLRAAVEGLRDAVGSEVSSEVSAQVGAIKVPKVETLSEGGSTRVSLPMEATNYAFLVVTLEVSSGYCGTTTLDPSADTSFVVSFMTGATIELTVEGKMIQSSNVRIKRVVGVTA